MQNVFSPLMSLYQNQLEASRKCAAAFFSGTEKIDRMLIGATQHVFNEQLNLAQSITTARDPRNVANAFQNRFMARNPDNTIDYQKEILQIYSEMQNEIGKSLQEYVAQLGGQAAENKHRLAEGAQAQKTNDAAFNPMTSMFSVWESAFKDVAALAKKNMMAAGSVGNDDVTTGGRNARNPTDVMSNNLRDAADAATAAVEDAERNAMNVAEDAISDGKGGASSSSGHKKKG